MQTKYILRKTTSYDSNYVSTSFLYSNTNDTYCTDPNQAYQFDTEVDSTNYVSSVILNHTQYPTFFEAVKIYTP